jgi:hypothetical protein
VRTQVRLHELAPATYPEPSKQDIEEALALARLVRDANDDAASAHVANAAFFVVSLSDVERDLAYLRFARKAGKEAGPIERRDDVKFDGPDPRTRNVVKDVIPPAVQASMSARDEYIRSAPGAARPERLEYAYHVAETYFLYGHWDLARKRLEPMWREHCGVDAYGSKAWEKLVTMAASERDADRALQLAEAVDPTKGGRSCDLGDGSEARIAEPIRIEAGFIKARRKLAEVCEAPLGQRCSNADAPGKKPLWRDVAALYERALERSSAGDDAPEALMNAAYCSPRYRSSRHLFSRCTTS